MKLNGIEIPPGIWKEIPGYGGKYQISTNGEVARVTTKGLRLLKSYRKKNQHPSQDRALVTLFQPNGKRQNITVQKLMKDTFLHLKPGQIVIHKNRDKMDNRLENLEVITRQVCGLRYGSKASSRVMRKVEAETGEIVQYYSSAREAARHEYLSRQSITNRCNKRIKKPAVNGFLYEWDDRPATWYGRVDPYEQEEAQDACENDSEPRPYDL